MEVCENLTDPTDPIFMNIMPQLSPGRMDALKDFPILEDHMKRIRNNPGIQAWRAKRPKNEEEKF